MAVDIGSVLAHQGGWDETLVILSPLVVFGLLLWVSSRRARKAGQAQAAEAAEPAEAADPPPPPSPLD